MAVTETRPELHDHAKAAPFWQQAEHDKPKAVTERGKALDAAISDLFADLRKNFEVLELEDEEDTYFFRQQRKPLENWVEETHSAHENGVFDPAEIFKPPAGYRRDSVGRWRYEYSGKYVPGAHDVTLGQLHPLAAHRGVVEISRRVVLCDDALAWAATFELGVRGATTVHRVPAATWEIAKHAVVTLAAGELCTERLFDPARLANLLGVKRNTVHAYLSRGLLPNPVARVGATPVWSLPAILDFVEHGLRLNKSR